MNTIIYNKKKILTITAAAVSTRVIGTILSWIAAEDLSAFLIIDNLLFILLYSALLIYVLKPDFSQYSTYIIPGIYLCTIIFTLIDGIAAGDIFAILLNIPFFVLLFLAMTDVIGRKANKKYVNVVFIYETIMCGITLISSIAIFALNLLVGIALVFLTIGAILFYFALSSLCKNNDLPVPDLYFLSQRTQDILTGKIFERNNIREKFISSEQQLKILNKLFSEGKISEEEYNAKRAEIIDRL